MGKPSDGSRSLEYVSRNCEESMLGLVSVPKEPLFGPGDGVRILEYRSRDCELIFKEGEPGGVCVSL